MASKAFPEPAPDLWRPGTGAPQRGRARPSQHSLRLNPVGVPPPACAKPPKQGASLAAARGWGRPEFYDPCWIGLGKRRSRAPASRRPSFPYYIRLSFRPLPQSLPLASQPRFSRAARPNLRAWLGFVVAPLLSAAAGAGPRVRERARTGPGPLCLNVLPPGPPDLTPDPCVPPAEGPHALLHSCTCTYRRLCASPKLHQQAALPAGRARCPQSTGRPALRTFAVLSL